MLLIIFTVILIFWTAKKQGWTLAKKSAMCAAFLVCVFVDDAFLQTMVQSVGF